MIGSAGVIVMDDSVSIPEALHGRWPASTPTSRAASARRAGSRTGWIYKMAHRIVGEGRGRKDDLDTILDVAKRGAGTTICAFYDGASARTSRYIEKFRAEFEALIRP